MRVCVCVDVVVCVYSMMYHLRFLSKDIAHLPPPNHLSTYIKLRYIPCHHHLGYIVQGYAHISKMDKPTNEDHIQQKAKANLASKNSYTHSYQAMLLIGG